MNAPTTTPEKKSSFYLPFLLLGKERREALSLLYRFCRAADDLSDEPGKTGEKRRRFGLFRRELESCLRGRPHPGFWTSFHSMVERYGLSPESLRSILRGVETDLGKVRFHKFSELLRYSQNVAGGPGLCAMAIFGGRSLGHERYALDLGTYLQVTNVLRDFLEDRDLGRLYLPSEDFKRFGVDPSNPQPGAAWDSFVRFELDRAKLHWESAKRSLSGRERSRLLAAEAMAAVYSVLHAKLRRNPGAILRGRVRLSLPVKCVATAWAALRCLVGRLRPVVDGCGC